MAGDILERYGQLFEHLENREFVELARPMVEQHIKELAIAETRFAELLQGGLKSEKNREFVTATLDEVRVIKARFESILAKGVGWLAA